MKKAMSYTLKAFFLMLLAFSVHRLLIFEFMAELLEKSPTNIMRALLVGWMSDVWICFLLSLLCLIIMGIAGLVPKHSKKIHRGYFFVQLVFLVLIAAQYSYVKFYHYQMIPLHLPYLLDLDFLKANSSSAFETMPLIFFSTMLVVFYRVWKSEAKLSLRTSTALYFTIAAMATTLHALNIRYRVNWFIPDTLRTNLVENYVLLAKQTRTARPLSPREHLQLSQQSLLSTTHTIQLNPIGQAIKKTWQESIANNESPLVIVLLLESLRYYDFGKAPTNTSGAGEPGGITSSPSLTPALDAIAERGIIFNHAYSNGTVTRSGQESILCPYLSSENNSLMRTRMDLKLQCLPRLISTQKPSALSFWLHGGVGAFDSQQQFWLQQQTTLTMTMADFPETAPRSGWGVSDLAFFNNAFDTLLQARKDHVQTPFMAGMLLSVTNHIPWDLPADAPRHILELSLPPHASYRTVAYTDYAVGEFVKKLKESGLWSRSLIIVTGDHGNLIEPYRTDLLKPNQDETPSQPSAIDQLQHAELLSHVPIIVSGGIAETARASSNADDSRETYVSHSGIFSFIAAVLDLETEVKADPLFSLDQKNPVLVDLGKDIYFPEKKRLANRNQLLDAQPFIGLERETLFYRQFMHSLQIQ